MSSAKAVSNSDERGRGRDGTHERRSVAVSTDPLDRLLARVLAGGDVAKLRQQLRAHASPDRLIQRLTLQFSAGSVGALIHALLPREAGAWLRDLDSLDGLLTQAAWPVASRVQARLASQGRLIAAGLSTASAGAREMPWHEIWLAVLSLRSVSVPSREDDALSRTHAIKQLIDVGRDLIDTSRPMVDALHRIARSIHGIAENEDAGIVHRSEDTEAQNEDDSASAAIASQRFEPTPDEPTRDVNIALHEASRERLKKLLAVAFMRGHAHSLYDVWPELVAHEPDLLLAAVRRYASVADLREQIASRFPASMLEDMLALLLTRIPDGQTHAPRRLSENSTASENVSSAWEWRRAWRRELAMLIEELPPALDVQRKTGREMRVATTSPRRLAEAVEPITSTDTDTSSDEGRRSGAAESIIPEIAPASDVHVPQTPSLSNARLDSLLRAMLSGSPASLVDDWQRWLADDGAALAQVWRHYAKYDTILMRVVESFPEGMLADLATALDASNSSLWHAFSALSVGLVRREDRSVSPQVAERWESAERATSSGGRIDVNEVQARVEAREQDARYMDQTDPPPSSVPTSVDFIQWKRLVWRRLFKRLIDGRSVTPSPFITPDGLSEVARSAVSLPWQHRAVGLWLSRQSLSDSAPHVYEVRQSASAETSNDANDASDVIDVIDTTGLSTPHDAEASRPVAVASLSERKAPTAALLTVVRRRNEVLPQGGDLIRQASHLSEAQRAMLQSTLAAAKSALIGGEGNLSANDWRAVVETMIAMSDGIPDVHRDMLHKSIAAQAPDVAPTRSDAVARYYASVAGALANDTVLELDVLSEVALAEAETSVDTTSFPPAPPHERETPPLQTADELTGTSPVLPAQSEHRPPAMPDDFIDYLTSAAFRQGHPPPSGLDIWLRQSVYSGAHTLRPVIALAADDEALAERWLDLIPQPLWPGIARLSSRDTPQVAQMLRVASDITELFATTAETVPLADLQRVRWSFLFSWLFAPQRPFDAAVFAGSLVATLARRSNVSVPPALAARIQQQTGIDMSPVASNRSEAPAAPVDAVVPHAGIVLAWPFLSRLWELLGLKNERGFVDEAAGHRAVLLLHYAGTGLTDVPEHALTMHKLLCGVPFETPVARHLDITDDEARMCDQMIDVMIQHWSALGNTSRAGLRETFLQREGRLSFAEDGWHLDIRRVTLDVLLARLPWSISTVRLSWMEKTLWVNWA
ncbi:hypothetical protein RO07_25230 [Pandoraea pulmonicola]|nr:hypothetical protein RO07_25230 [Pandoraea pulmonicola]